MNNRKDIKLGFTLAEVLITLVVIGVIAAFTVPTLMKSTQKQELVAGLKKANTVLSQALMNISRNNDAAVGDYSFLNDVDFIDEFAKVTNTLKKCDNLHDCFGKNYSSSIYKLLNSSNSTLTDGKSVITSDGFMFSYNTIGGIVGLSAEDTENVIGRIIVDINGSKNPNIVGRDVFAFYIVNGKGIVPAGASAVNGANGCSASATGYACAGRVLRENAMNY